MPADNDPYQQERRRYRRFPVSLKLSYKLATGRMGTGEVADMSSGGLRFRGSETLPIGELVEADVSWPFLLNQTQPLVVRVRGMVIRNDAGGTAISISRYEFHTRKL